LQLKQFVRETQLEKRADKTDARIDAMMDGVDEHDKDAKIREIYNKLVTQYHSQTGVAAFADGSRNHNDAEKLYMFGKTADEPFKQGNPGEVKDEHDDEDENKRRELVAKGEGEGNVYSRYIRKLNDHVKQADAARQEGDFADQARQKAMIHHLAGLLEEDPKGEHEKDDAYHTRLQQAAKGKRDALNDARDGLRQDLDELKDIAQGHDAKIREADKAFTTFKSEELTGGKTPTLKDHIRQTKLAGQEITAETQGDEALSQPDIDANIATLTTLYNYGLKPDQITVQNIKKAENTRAQAAALGSAMEEMANAMGYDAAAADEPSSMMATSSADRMLDDIWQAYKPKTEADGGAGGGGEAKQPLTTFMLGDPSETLAEYEKLLGIHEDQSKVKPADRMKAIAEKWNASDEIKNDHKRELVKLAAAATTAADIIDKATKKAEDVLQDKTAPLKVAGTVLQHAETVGEGGKPRDELGEDEPKGGGDPDDTSGPGVLASIGNTMAAVAKGLGLLGQEHDRSLDEYYATKTALLRNVADEKKKAGFSASTPNWWASMRAGKDSDLHTAYNEYLEHKKNKGTTFHKVDDGVGANPTPQIDEQMKRDL
jgi:hypothetical protein